MMITIEDIHKHIEKNSIPKNGLIYIGDETLKIIRNCKDFHDTFNKIPAEGYDRIVFFGTTDDYGRFHLKINYSEFKEKPKFTSETLIENAFVLGDIHFSDIVFNENFSLTIEDTDDNVSISFVNCHFMGKLKIRNKENNDCEEDCKDCEEYSQKKIKLKSLKFIDCLMGGSDGGIDPYLRCGFLDVENFVLKNLRVPNNAEVNIGECHFEIFRLSNFRNLGKFKLYKINENFEANSKCKFQIDNTSIGDADFQSLNLVSFKIRKIFDNILSGIDYTNIQWEKPETEIEVGQFTQDGRIVERKNMTKKEKITEKAKKRDTYRVLKNVAQRNNDMQQAFAFYAKEVKSHRELLALTAKVTKICELCESGELSKLFDRVSLCFGACTSNYGQNWALPIFWILVLGGIFYNALCCGLVGNFDDCRSWGKFFSFLIPIPDSEFFGDNGGGFLMPFLYILFRILEGALIYQAIQAFRKYSRKF